MRTGNEEETKALLNRVNWEFEDYVSSSYPEDINSLHWYPAAFVPQIPSILIQIFSQKGNVVLDPFVGSGVTLVEAAKQDRVFTGLDSNPYAIEISKAKFEAIACNDWNWAISFTQMIRGENLVGSPEEYCQKMGINTEVTKWFHPNTLRDLLTIYDCIVNGSSQFFLLKKVIFSSILKSCCSQRKHYTYITDRCFPSELFRVNAKDKYIQQLRLVQSASEKFRQQYTKINSKELSDLKGEIKIGDARDMHWIKDESIDLIVTSPPYLGCNDYAKSMRLTHLFFPTYSIPELIEKEIGARCKRHKKTLQKEYVIDMKRSFQECERVLDKAGYLALIFGQGKGRARKIDVVHFMTKFIVEKLEFRRVFDTKRNIKFHRVRFPGVEKEHIMVFKKH